MRGPYLVAFLQASLAAAAGYCPPLGPVFPAARSLSTSASFKSDLEKLQATLQDAFSSGNTSYGPVNPNDTYSIQIFSARDARPLMDFSHRGTGVEDNKEVTGDSIFGIASTTKLITVYLLLLEAGDGIWAEKVTKYLPELASKGYWDDITVGALAGYVGGTVSEAYGIENISFGGLGAILPDAFPPLDPDEVPPCAYGQSGCTREIFLKNLATRRQVYLPNTTPAYGNAAFATLGLILESKTGLSYADNLAKLLNSPLNLSSTTSTPPSSDNPHVIFGTDPSAAWNITLDGAGTGMGALFSSTNDLSAIGRSILSSSLLPPNTTRAWLKPTSHTSSLTGSVGHAWEIYRVPLGPAENNRVVDMYTKAGNGFGYGSTIALIPDFDVGFVALQAGSYGTVPLGILSTITDHLLPALEDAARLEAENVFAGTYSAANNLNSSLTITSTKGVPGLTITQWISNGTDIAGLVFGAPTLQMYPTNLMRDESTYSWRVGTARTQPPGPFSACPSWFALDRPPYGVYGVDEVEFKVGGSGRAEMAEPKAFKVVLERDG